MRSFRNTRRTVRPSVFVLHIAPLMLAWACVILQGAGPAPAAEPASTAPRDLEVFQPVRSVERYGKFEVGVQFAGAGGNLFDPDETRVVGVFTDPGGLSETISGFLAGYADSERFGPSWPIFLLRFTPGRAGQWKFVVRVENPQGQLTSRTRWFTATASERGGFVRVSAQDPRYFELDSGDFFYPIGQNIAWSQDYEPYLDRQAETGQNWVRIWMCPWNLQLEKAPGLYDLDAAARLDRIVEMAAARGIRIQLVLVYHGMAAAESWSKNPYNLRNGGPCRLPGEFFTNAQARRLFRKRLDYIVARWGYSTSIFAWELMNEADLCDHAAFGDVVAWHRQMSRYLKRIDPNDHLVTTSLKDAASQPDLWRLPDVDFTQAHVYGPRPARRILHAYRSMRRFNKPFFVGEYGRRAFPDEAQQDPHGEALREALWGAFMLPTAGGAMPWWWDTHIRPRKLEHLFLPLASFAEDMDRRGQNYRLIETTMSPYDAGEAAVRGLLNHHSCYLWFYPPPGVPDARAGDPPAPIAEGREVGLSGMLEGRYELAILDTATGRILRRGILDSNRGKLAVPLPEAPSGFAVKVQYLGNPEPRFLISPEPTGSRESPPGD